VRLPQRINSRSLNKKWDAPNEIIFTLVMISQNPYKVYYPDSDGQRMADKIEQFCWIVTIEENLNLLFSADNLRELGIEP
jgi:hypothetical protein